ncbi:DUF1294 domain-containing protein [Halopseudomonas pelagia]|uniref:DUF1294 domain-containing protein n=1 Tax=Halopseudomonas pelagia TaxID=553151 RepID=UPI0030DADB17|tara:strand:+ start:6066 stop:6794 length:729 start_codon:yes stop_codon:yes gene_type:complete
MEQRGVLLSWNDGKGFGFIQPEKGGAKLFVHISAMRGDARPNQGDAVFYLAGADEKGRLRATHMRGEGLSIDRPSIRQKPREPSVRQPARKAIKSAGKGRSGREPRAAARRSSAVPYQALKLMVWLALCALPLIGSLQVLNAQGWVLPLGAYAGVSLVSFFLYWSDKRAAEQSSQRTPEKVLHLSELLGGWPGALVAQQLLRHKTRKASYQQLCWLIIVVHQLFWVDWVLLDSRYLRQLLGS